MTQNYQFLTALRDCLDIIRDSEALAAKSKITLEQKGKIQAYASLYLDEILGIRP